MSEDIKIKGASYEIAIGSVFAVCLTLIIFLLFAVSMGFFELSNAWVRPVTEIARVISIVAGCAFGIRNAGKSLIKGLIIGAAYAILSIVIFSIIDMRVGFQAQYILDILASLAAGALGGALIAILKK
ncbi:MAG: TIGR04086 family membrane protein [Firmicutes bacterium]|nr:TIGR04086 family membrane protein [Bacillota bacterium]